ncbi:B12-binding domain-containing radical SAM protein [Chloroflexota bacterium]
MTRKKIKKVLLFIPPAFTFKDSLDVNPLPPLGLGYLGAVLENAGIEVKVVDCLMEGWNNRVEVAENIIRVGLPFDQIDEIIRSYGPDIVGVNNLFTKQRENAHKIYELAKRADSSIITIAGGAHPTVMPELVLADKNVDYVVLGEGDDTILDLVNVIEGKSDISSLDGVGYTENGLIRVIPKTKFITDLDRLPFPARHLLNMEKYFGLKASHGTRKKERFSPIVTSRGCPAKCTFCSAHRVWGRKFRQRSPENVIEEMKHLKEKYGIEEIMFEDDNVTLNVGRAEKLFDLMIEEKLNFVWDTPNGVAAFALNEKLLDKIKKSGCYSLNLALESGNQYVLDNIIKKPVKLERAKQLVRYAQHIGLGVKIYLIMGMPGETKEQIWDSFLLAKVLGIFTPFISIATPYPGSELYEVCRKNKYIPDDFSLDDLFIRSFSISTENWTGEEIREIYREGQRFLSISDWKRHPYKLLPIVLRGLFTHPVSFTRNVFNFAINRGPK